MSMRATRGLGLVPGATGSLLLLALPALAIAQDPAEVGSWGPVQSVPVGPTHSIVLPTGKVLFFGEFEKGDRHFEWDPATGDLLELPYAGFNIFCAGHTHLEDGKIFITGGHIDEHVGEPQSVIYDPYTREWLPVPLMNDGRWYPSATTLPNGEVLVVGGETHGAGLNNPFHQVYIPWTNTWRDIPNSAANLPYYTRQFVDLNGDIIIVNPRRQTYVITTEGLGTFQGTVLANHTLARTYGSGVMFEEGKIISIGGGVPPTATAEILDLDDPNPQWRMVAPMSVPRRQHNAVLLPDGKILVIGGSSGAEFDDRTSPVLHTEVFDPETETWTIWASHAMYRGYHSTAVLLPDGRIFAGGGRHDDTMEVFSPPYLFKGPKPVYQYAPKWFDPDQPFVVLTPEYDRIQKVSLIHLGATTHAFDMAQRYLSLEFVRFQGGLVVKAPRNNNVAPPGHYMLFLVDDKGVPSHGEIVRVSNTTRPPIGIGAPHVDEVHIKDTHMEIKWWAEYPTREVDIEYSVDGGATWQTIVSRTDNDGSYIWVVPEMLEDNVRIRIRDSNDPSREAINSGPFTILPGPLKVRVPWGSHWKFWADGTYPGDGWTEPGFDDDDWEEGHASLGYGRTTVHTLLPKTTPSQPSVYFRREFDIDDPVILAARVTAMHDDGIAVWVNGTLVHERYMDKGMGHGIYASASVNDEVTQSMFDPSILRQGTNTVAVMVKNNGPTSPDINFDLQLEIVVPLTHDIEIVYPEPGQKLGVNQVVPIMWETIGYAPTVDIEWSDDGGITWKVLAKNTENTGRFEWQVPSTPSSNLMVRVLRTLDRSTYDEIGPLSSHVPTRTVLVPWGSTWKYKDDNKDPGDDWHRAGYSDASWPQGDAPLGYDYGGLGTTLQKTTPAQYSTYFRKTFTLPNYISGARVTLRVDDGAAVWLNSEVVAKYNVGNLAHDRYASSSINASDVTIELPVEAFQVGTNILGVMLKQAGKTSPDLYFDLELEVDLLP